MSWKYSTASHKQNTSAENKYSHSSTLPSQLMTAAVQFMPPSSKGDFSPVAKSPRQQLTVTASWQQGLLWELGSQEYTSAISSFCSDTFIFPREMNFTTEMQSSFKWETKGYSITSQELLTLNTSCCWLSKIIPYIKEKHRHNDSERLSSDYRWKTSRNFTLVTSQTAEDNS